MRSLIGAAIVITIITAGHGFAVEPQEILTNSVLEARARDLSRGLRCLVCQNQSIDDSNAELASDLRLAVRQRLLAGDSDDQVLDYVVARYGDYILLQPPFKPATWLLWFGPLLITLIGLAGIGFYWCRQRRRIQTIPEPVLSTAERDYVRKLIASDID